MGHTWKNSSQLNKFLGFGKMGYSWEIRTPRKITQTLTNRPHFKNEVSLKMDNAKKNLVTLNKLATLGEMGRFL